MAGKDIIQMSQKELRRLHVIRKAIEGLIRQKKAAEMLSLSDRQTRRLIKTVGEEGDAGIIHKSRGKPSNRSIQKEIMDKIIELYRKDYLGFGPVLASEKLLERDGISVNHHTCKGVVVYSRPERESRPSPQDSEGVKS